MFEVEDEKLGRLKIFNVSEARAQFAHVLKEGAKVVITRHGRPSKILINYEEYLSLMKAPPSEKSVPLPPPNPVRQPSLASAPLPGRWTEEDLDQIVQTITHSLSTRRVTSKQR
jgi:prevent-host-death family protein